MHICNIPILRNGNVLDNIHEIPQPLATIDMYKGEYCKIIFKKIFRDFVFWLLCTYMLFSFLRIGIDNFTMWENTNHIRFSCKAYILPKIKTIHFVLKTH